MTGGWVVVKLGGELLEGAARMDATAKAVAVASRTTRLAVVHGGGREIDAALARSGIEKRQVDGIRVTDEATLDVVVAVLAGAVNTRFVAAIGAAGASAVGLTGADARLVLVAPAAPHVGVDGTVTDLGRVGRPCGPADVRVLKTLADGGHVPVIATIGAAPDGALYNVNADTFAAHLSAATGARLVIAGATAGVLDEAGRTIPALDRTARARLIASGVASAGMVAKLRACEEALAGGAREVVLVDGRDPEAVKAAIAGADERAPSTRMVA